MSKWKAVGQFAKSNPYTAAAAVIIGGFSFFSARKAEKARRERLKGEMDERIGNVLGETPEIIAEYTRTADTYRAQGNSAGASIYDNAVAQLQQGGQGNLAYSEADNTRNRMSGLLGSRLEGINLASAGKVMSAQNALASELNRQDINIDKIRADYAKQGIPSAEVSVGDVNTLKYV